MSLLPKSTTEFTDPKYWKNFFATRKAPFEWYGDYGVLGSVLEKYLKTTDKILQIGCGNSQLAAQMYDNGFRNVHSIDTDSSVIEEQRLRNRERSELCFSKEDATSMSFADEDFSVVVDKGTLDALLPPEASEQQLDCVNKMFCEVQRVLKVAGRCLIVTLAQHHIVKHFMEHFLSKHQFLLRVHELENSASGFPMPIFILVATKLRNVMLMSMPIELCRAGSDRFEKFAHLHDVLSVIASEQELSQFVHMCSRKLDHEASISIESQFESGPRYRIYIVDDINVKIFRSYAVFVVPLGREGEWIFSTEKGRMTLRQQAEKDRLAVVTLSRSQTYTSLQQVQDELGPFATRFDPRENGGLIDFLSTGSVDVRVTRASGESVMNGKWTVEDVVVDGQEYRRLVFLSSSNIVQSEALLKSKKGGKKAVDLENLSCDHHILMLSGLALLPSNPLHDPTTAQLKMAVLGLGGGLLASFLLRNLNKAAVEGVELDGDLVNVAAQWFALPSHDTRLSVKVMDAVVYLEQISARDEKEKLDMMFVDLAGPVHESGLSCPPAIFLTDPVLCNMKNSLNSNGVIAMNLVTRDEEVALNAKRSMAAHFPTLYSIRSEEDVNEVLLACTAHDKNFDAVQIARSLRKDIGWVNALEPVIARITSVSVQ
uniref:Methyltransf_11 domain-containing protein n=1 Tax=Haemonchus contortus TaxID=6289 RepID=A0A912MPY0_HAECO